MVQSAITSQPWRPQRHAGRGAIVVQRDMTDDDGHRVAQITHMHAVITDTAYAELDRGMLRRVRGAILRACLTTST